MVRLACQVAHNQTHSLKSASHSTGLSIGVIEVIAKHLTANSRHDFTERKAFMSLVKKVKQLIDLFKKAPQAWDKFKEMLGLTETGLGLVKEIDTKLGNLLEEGKKKLTQVAKKVWNEFPILRLMGEVLEEKNRWEVALEKAKSFVPEKILDAFKAIESGASKLGDFLDGILAKSKVLKALSAPIKIYLFFQIWDWFADFDFRVVVKGLLGTIDFSDLISLLPSEGIEIILELILPPPANGALAKLVIEAGIASTFGVIMVLEVKYLMGVYKVNNTSELLRKLESNG
jgi:hypothetical protein